MFAVNTVLRRMSYGRAYKQNKEKLYAEVYTIFSVHFSKKCIFLPKQYSRQRFAALNYFEHLPDRTADKEADAGCHINRVYSVKRLFYGQGVGMFFKFRGFYILYY